MNKQREFLFCGDRGHRVDTLICSTTACEYFDEMDGDVQCNWGKPTGRKVKKSTRKTKVVEGGIR